MSESFVNDKRTMSKNVAVILTIVCLMLCLSINYTFPLNRDFTEAPVHNHSQSCGGKQEHIDGIVDKTKKMAMNLELALKKFIESTPKKTRDKCSHSKHGIVDNDLNNYEQLVIMKKYPFLDLQELEFNVGQLANKNAGQSDQALTAQDSTFYESSDDGPSVEITNRGLSGFALPSKLQTATPEAKKILSDIKVVMKDDTVANKKALTTSPSNDPSDDLSMIESLEEDIKRFVGTS